MKAIQFNPYGTYNDLRMDTTDQRSVNAPTFADFGSGVYCNRLDSGANDEVHNTTQVDHGINGAPLPITFHPHVHLMPTVNVLPAHTINLQWIYFWIPIGALKPAAVTLQILFTGLTIAANTHHIFEFGQIYPTGEPVSAIVVSRFSRRSLAGGDSYPGNLWLLGIDWHYQTDWPGGTIQEFP